MPCTYPLKMYQEINPRTGELGKPQFVRNMSIKDFNDYVENVPHRIGHIIPCGQCAECRRDYANLWSDRLVLEAQTSPPGSSWFVTLTYDEQHEPRAFTIDRQTGIMGRLGVLDLDDVSAWVKRLRSYFSNKGIDGLRFFACGEYGEKSRRPHYHVILFNCFLPDCRSVKPSDDGFLYLPRGVFFSELVESLWHDENGARLGLTSVSPADPANIRYTAGYSVKKLRGLHEREYLQLIEEEAAENPGLVPQPREVARMSRRPGIGVPWYDSRDHADIWRSGKVWIPDTDGAHSRNAPRVFERPDVPDVAELIDEAKRRRLEGAQSAKFLSLLHADGMKEEELLLNRARAYESNVRMRAKRSREL